VTVLKLTPVSMLVAATLAPGMAAPAGSDIVPVMRLDVVWATASPQRLRASKKLFMNFPFNEALPN
jgi:hypothetical protein